MSAEATGWRANQECVLQEGSCVECLECLYCDLDPFKECDNCMSCITEETDFKAVLIQDILTLEEENQEQGKARSEGENQPETREE